MDHQWAMDIISGRRQGVAATLLRTALLGASWPYGLAMRLRRRAYGWGVLGARRAELPVISIGNLTTGGTGKTPMVALIANELAAAGAKVAIVMRGYKAVNGRSDEAQLLGELCGPAVQVIVNPDRVAGAKQAVQGGATVIVLDDGFQHQRLRRDMDIVLVDATNPFGYGHCLPRGLMREPPGALRAADAIVITRSDAIAPAELDALKTRLSALAPRATLHTATHRPSHVVDESGNTLSTDSVAGLKVYAFCGIGNPDAFFETLQDLGVRLAGWQDMGDHCDYTLNVLDTLLTGARHANAVRLLTTQKDYVKLAGTKLSMPLWHLVVQLDLLDGRDQLLDRVRQWAK